MPLIRLTYSSLKNDDMEKDEIENILDIARMKNKKHNITGMLCFNRKYFLQILEGERGKVCELFSKISQDRRHNSVVLYQVVEVSKREFDNWSMGFIPESSLTSSVILKYSNGTVFDPTEMSSESILDMMVSLKETVPIQ